MTRNRILAGRGEDFRFKNIVFFLKCRSIVDTLLHQCVLSSVVL